MTDYLDTLERPVPTTGKMLIGGERGIEELYSYTEQKAHQEFL